jgi:hypothetical protein
MAGLCDHIPSFKSYTRLYFLSPCQLAGPEEVRARGVFHLCFGSKGIELIVDLGFRLRAALHLEAGPIPLEVDCMKFQVFLGWRPASTPHYNKIITGANFPICKGLRFKRLG